MEVLVPIIVEAVLETVREDVIDYLIQSKACSWSKRKIRKICSKKEDSVERALERVHQATNTPTIMKYATKISSI